jgi:hypothetical protein
VALPNTTPAMPAAAGRSPPTPRATALDAEQPPDHADERGAGRHHERRGARRAARDPLDEAHLVEPVPEHAEHGEAHGVAARGRAVAAGQGDGAEQRAGEQHRSPLNASGSK